MRILWSSISRESIIKSVSHYLTRGIHSGLYFHEGLLHYSGYFLQSYTGEAFPREKGYVHEKEEKVAFL